MLGVIDGGLMNGLGTVFVRFGPNLVGLGLNLGRVGIRFARLERRLQQLIALVLEYLFGCPTGKIWLSLLGDAR